MIKPKHLLFSLAFALIAAAATLFVAQAQVQPDATVIPAQVDSTDCYACHQDFQEAWASGAHGHATNDPVFNQLWVDQGQPGACLVCHVTGYDPATGTWEKDGVACETCHNPVPTNHPEEPMPIDQSAELCGQCHSDARFGWDEWQTSTHFQRAMTCSVCHDPHSAGLKTVEGLEVQGSSGLCINCHRDYMTDFPYSIHSQASVECVDCHLHNFGVEGDRDIHTMPDHSFSANLAACTTCHVDQMHGQTASAALDLTITPTPEPVLAQDETLEAEPAPVSPYGFAGLAGLLGLAGGVVLSPWLEKAYRKINKGK